MITLSSPWTDWTHAEATALFEVSFADLIWQAQTVHRARFGASEVQMSTFGIN